MLACALSALAQETCTRHMEAAGGFSYCLPAGWTVQEYPGQKFKVVTGPTSEVFTANINVQANNNTAELRSYADAGIKAYLANGGSLGKNNLSLAGRSEFITDSGEKADKAVFRVEHKGMMVLVLQYVVDTGKGKLHFTGTTLESEKGVNEKLFDAAMKTFKIEKLTVVGMPLETASGRGTGQGSGIGVGQGPPKSGAPTTGVRILAKAKANSTEAACRENFSGNVILRITFLASGEIGTVAVAKGAPYGLVEQAIAAAKTIRFEPAKVNGVLTSVTKLVEYTFD